MMIFGMSDEVILELRAAYLHRMGKRKMTVESVREVFPVPEKPKLPDKSTETDLLTLNTVDAKIDQIIEYLTFNA